VPPPTSPVFDQFGFKPGTGAGASGYMHSFMTAHLSADGAANGPVTMGYFTRSELAFYHALADAFAICDGYF